MKFRMFLPAVSLEQRFSLSTGARSFVFANTEFANQDDLADSHSLKRLRFRSFGQFRTLVSESERSGALAGSGL